MKSLRKLFQRRGANSHQRLEDVDADQDLHPMQPSFSR